MRIGILTHPLDYNYGCLLQNFALQTILKKMGYEVITINRFSAPPTFLSLLKNWIARLFLRTVKHRKVSLSWNTRLNVSTIDVLSTNTKKFVDRNITCTERVFPKDLKRIDQNYMFDAYIVGSDQVWLPHFCLNAFLDFVKRDNVKCLFYAASSGKVSFADDSRLVKKCKELSKRFSGISVREDSLISVSKNCLEKDAVHVLDPTLLLDSKDYLEACVENSDTKPIIFTYILDKTPIKAQIVNKAQIDLNLPIVNGSVEEDYRKDKSMDINKCIYPSVDSWILNMKRSKFVVTDSFHGTCMAIVFRKPFVVIGNLERGLERFNSILKLFELQDRLITDVSEFDASFYNQLDNKLTERIELLKERSLDYLTHNLA